MLVVVLAEHHIQQSALVVENGDRIEFVIPDDVVCLDKRCVLGRGDELFKRSHKLFDFKIGAHAADAIVAACDHAQQFAVGCTVVSDGDCVVSLACNKRKHVGKRVVGREVAVGHHEACLVVFDFAHHLRLALDGLRAEYKRNPAFSCQCDCERVVAHRLHDGRSHRDVE